MVTMKEEIKVGEITNVIKDNAEQLGIERAECSSLLSSFARVYKETTSPVENWQKEIFTDEDFEKRLVDFEEKLQGRFAGKSTLSVYKARAKKLVRLYETIKTKRRSSTESCESRDKAENETAKEIIEQLVDTFRNPQDTGIYRFTLSEEKKAFLITPRGKNGSYLRQINSELGNIIKGIDESS